MSNQNGRPSHSLLVIPIFLCILTAPATARGQEPAAPRPSSQQTPESKNSADTKDNKKQGEKQKKSKLEQETGTTNDRITSKMRSFVVPVSCSSLLFFCFSPCFLLFFVSALFLLSGVCWLDGGGAAGPCPRAVAGAVRMQRKMEISSKEWLGLPFWLLMVRLNYLPGLADFGNQVHAELPKEAGAPAGFTSLKNSFTFGGTGMLLIEAIRHLADPNSAAFCNAWHPIFKGASQRRKTGSGTGNRTR